MIEAGVRYVEEYRDKKLVFGLAEIIRKSVSRDYVFMEVCGGHTSAIHRFGIPSLLPSNIRLISGPGCPVCVTGTGFIDTAIECSKLKEVIIATFGDLIRVPGSSSSLEKEKSSGADIRIVSSALEALEIAVSNHGKRVVFLGIGFETTAPGTAVTIEKAKGDNIKNFFVLCAHKVMPPAMTAIIMDGTKLDGFICPGHVATITGSDAFRFLPETYRLGCVIAGFEPIDLLQSIRMLVRQVNTNSPQVETEYTRAVTQDGNSLARMRLSEVFELCNATWRGLGVIPQSGLGIRREFDQFDAEKAFPVKIINSRENGSCICGNILRGLNTPDDCPLFAKACVPDNPVGACMVSNEGACNIFYRYH
jgi:hydrogenase expression/formation protein HypD